MRCWCAMGKDRDCPEDCPVGAYAALPAKERKARRKPLAEKLYKNGMTMEQIAAELGASHQTIGRDLEFVQMDKPHRPKGGRPKGAGKVRKPRKKQADGIEDKIIAMADQGIPSPEIAAQLGIDGRAIRHIIERERIRREGQADPIIERDDLPLSAQQKLDAAIRQHKRKLDSEFEARVLDECERRLNEFSLPAYVEEMRKLEHSITSRKGGMSKEIFRLILSCLHADSRNSASDEKLNRAFHEFASREKRLVDEKGSPTEFKPLPKTVAEMAAMRKNKGKKPTTGRRKLEIETR